MLQYLDLDLDVSDNFATTTLPPAQSPPNTTVYKTVDFLKTEAFNRTRQRVEEERKRTDVDWGFYYFFIHKSISYWCLEEIKKKRFIILF